MHLGGGCCLPILRTATLSKSRKSPLGAQSHERIADSEVEMRPSRHHSDWLPKPPLAVPTHSPLALIGEGPAVPWARRGQPQGWGRVEGAPVKDEPWCS